MIETVNVTKIIAAPADQAWQAIAGIEGLDRWFPVIASCIVTGNGVGASRVMTLTTGEKITDRIEAIDHHRKRFQYNRIESPFPVSRYWGIVDISRIGPNSSEIAWTLELNMLPEKREELVGFLRQTLSDGIDGLERDLVSTTGGGHEKQ